MAKEDLSEAVKRIVVSFINACSTTLKNGINIKISNGLQSNHIPTSYIDLFKELIKKIITAYKKISKSEIGDLEKSIFEEHNDSVESIVKELENSMESIVNEIEKKNKGLKNKILYVYFPDNYLKQKNKNIKNHTSNGHDQSSSDHSGNNQTVEIINKEKLSKHEYFQERKRDIIIKYIGIKKLGMRRDSIMKNLCENSINEYSKLKSDIQSLEKIVFSFLKTNNENLLNEIIVLMNKILNNMKTNGITSNLESNIQDGSKLETNKNYIQIVNYNGNYYISQLIQFLSEKQFTQRGKQSILFHFLDHDIKELGKYLKFLFEFSNNNVNNSIDNNTIDNNTFENNTINNNNINNNIINNNINLQLKNEYNFSLDMYPVHENLLNLIINDLINNEKQELNIVQLLVISYILEFYKNNNDYKIHDDILLNIKLHHMKLPQFISDQDNTINSVLIKNINAKKNPNREKKRKREEEEFNQSQNKDVVPLENNKKFKMKKSLGESVKPLETTENMDKKLYINKKQTNNSVNQREDNQWNTRINHELGKQQIIQNFIKNIDDEGVLKIIPFDLLIQSFREKNNLSIDEYCFICAYNTLQFAIVVIIQELIKFLQQHFSELSKEQVGIVINNINQLKLNLEKIHYNLQYSSYIKCIILLSITEKTEKVDINTLSCYIICKVLLKIIDECSDFKFSKYGYNYGGDNCSILNINIVNEYIEKYMKFSNELYSNFYSILKQDLCLPYSLLK